jgi:hypothetical protein
MYFRGQGKLYIGTRDTLGNPQALRWVGNCPELKLGLQVDNIEHKESYSGQALTDLKIPKGKSTSLNFTLEDFNKDNLAMALYGVALSVAAGTAITGEVLGGTPAITTLAVGQVFTSAKRNVGGTVVLKDSTGSPKTLTLNTNYTLEPISGTITLIDITTGGPFVGPLKLDYTPGISTEIGMFNTPMSDLFLRFVGMNSADSGKVVSCDLYKVNINPTKELSLITDDMAQLQIEGSALLDPTKPSSATLGQFGAIYQQ